MNPTKSISLKRGQRFIPFRLFRGMFIPNVLAKSKLLTPGQKILWARLSQYAGEDGLCYPGTGRLISELGMSKSGVMKCINELIAKGFLEKYTPGKASQGKKETCRYFFLWHPVFEEALEAPSTQSGLDRGSSNRAGTQSTPCPVHRVDYSSPQSGPKENNQDNKNTTTTTTEQRERKSESSGRSGGFSLSESQRHYIELKVKRTAMEGDLKKSNPARFENYLIRMAKLGKLDMADKEELEDWNRSLNSQRVDADSLPPIIIQDKEKLHEEQALKDEESLAWWERLEEDHPVRRRIKPPYMPEKVWIRQLYAEFSNYKSITRKKDKLGIKDIR